MVPKTFPNHQVSWENQMKVLKAIMEMYNRFIGNCDECRQTRWLEKIRKSGHTEWWCRECVKKVFKV
jgi:formamidopyrimidine-DNA glycosylase